MDRVFRRALVVALLAHVAASALFAQRRIGAQSEVPRPAPTEATIEASIELEALVPAPPSNEGGASLSPARPDLAVAIAVPARPPHSPARAPGDVSPTDGAPPGPASSGSAIGSTAPTATSTGSPGSNAPTDPLAQFDPAGARPSWMPGSIGAGVALPQASATPAQVLAAKVDRDVTTLVDAKSAGAAFAGPLVGVAHATAMDPSAPDVGSALLLVRTDASGTVTSVSVADVSSDMPGWSAVGAKIKLALASKRLVVPPGASGVAVSLRITARYALPSGAGKPIDPFVGGSAGIGGGLKFDLSDIGQKPARVVAVLVLDEKRL